MESTFKTMQSKPLKFQTKGVPVFKSQNNLPIFNFLMIEIQVNC